MQLSRLESDYDVFPVDGFDDIIVMKSLQLLTEKEIGKEDRAKDMDRKVSRITAEKVQHLEGPEEKKIYFAPNPLFGMFNNYNPYGAGRRMNTRSGSGW